MTAAAVSAVMTATVSAYDINKDFGTGWSASTTVPSSEFEGLTDSSVITLTFTTDDSLADVEGHSYWVIKPMVNDAGWPLITGISELNPSEDGSSYTVEPGDTTVSFSIPEDFVEQVKTAGVAFMGHGVTLETMTIADAPAEQDAPAADETTAQDTSAAATDTKGNPDTGVEGVAAAASIALAAAGAMALSRKRR
jgi:hypothetical protein